MRRFGLEPTTAAGQAQKWQGSLQAFAPLPKPTGAPPFRKTSAELEIPEAKGGVRTFHVIGDTGGVANPTPQDEVVKAMIADLVAHPEVAFAWHVGDLAYFQGERQAFETQVFEAYCEYQRHIVGHTGNHDGAGYDLFAEFMRYFCAQKPELLPEVEEYHRDSMDLPNVYWTLRDPLLTMIALCTNVPSGGVVKPDQAEWFVEELKAAPAGVALGVSLHHPPLSCDARHGGSAQMAELLKTSFAAAGRVPDIILAGHIHDFQRFSWRFGSKVVPSIVCGAGGYRNRHPMASGAGPGLDVGGGATLEAFDATQWGFLSLSVTAKDITGVYTGVAGDGTVTPAVDTFTSPVG